MKGDRKTTDAHQIIGESFRGSVAGQGEQGDYIVEPYEDAPKIVVKENSGQEIGLGDHVKVVVTGSNQAGTTAFGRKPANEEDFDQRISNKNTSQADAYIVTFQAFGHRFESSGIEAEEGASQLAQYLDTQLDLNVEVEGVEVEDE